MPPSSFSGGTKAKRTSLMAYNGTVRDIKAPILRLAVSGKMRSGKDTLAERLVERYGFRRYAFADRLKEVANELFAMPPGVKNRHLLVELGRKMCEVDKLVWVNYVLSQMPLRCDVIISDLRFKYEYYALKAFDFIVVRVDSDEVVRLKRVERFGSRVDLALVDDPSETDLDEMEFDWIIHGTTYDSLYDEAAIMMKAMGRAPAHE